MTLTCEDAYSKLVEVVTVAYVSDKDRVDNSFLLAHCYATFLCSWDDSLVGQQTSFFADFEAEVWS